MTERALFLRQSLLVAPLTALALAASGVTARAQIEIEEEEKAPAAMNGPMQMQVVYMLDEASYHRMVFGNRTPDTVRDRFERLLDLKIAEVDRACSLNEAQKEKLQLAGRGDVERLFDRIEGPKNFLNKQMDQNEYMKIIQELRPVQLALNADPFGGGSLLSKALRGVLDERQSARFEGADRDKTRQRYRVRVEQVVMSLDSTLGLSAEQRRRLVTLLLDETRPPKKSGPYDLQVVLYQASQLPEAKLRPIFDDAQWRGLGRHFTQAKSMERTLRSGDFLPDDATGATGRFEHD